MSKITTRSVFYWGTKATIMTRALDFSEGGPELQATLKVSDYTLTEYAAEVQRALREAGTQAYVVSVNRTTRKLTISAPLNFELLSFSGSRVGTSAWSTMGFSTLVDKTGSNSYVGELGAGFEYQTQHPINKYVSPNHSIVKENATYNSTPLGTGQLTSFGDGARISMNIRLITNLTGLKNEPFFDNVNGVDDFLDFMGYLMEKAKVEFMPDVSDRATFFKVLLEATKQDRAGLKFELTNMKTPEIYESGELTFRKVLV